MWIISHPQVYMKLRPHVQEFLQSMVKSYEVCVLTYWLNLIEDEVSCLFSSMFLEMEWIIYQPKSGVNLAIEFCGVFAVLQMQYFYHTFPVIHIFDLSFCPVAVICLHVCKEGLCREDPEHPGPTEKSLSVCLITLLQPCCRSGLIVNRRRTLFAIASGFVFVDIVCIRKIAFVFLVTTSRISASSAGISPRLWFWTTCPIHTHTM